MVHIIIMQAVNIHWEELSSKAHDEGRGIDYLDQKKNHGQLCNFTWHPELSIIFF